jgi:SAM-dependent methyltransferase
LLSRRALFGLGLSRAAERVEEQFDAQAREPGPAPRPPAAPGYTPPAHPDTPPPRPSWPHRRGAELWAPVSRALPRPEGERVLEVDDLDYDLARLPLADGEFDVAVSAFAPMFSSDGRAAIAELLRVVRPGGIVAFATWTQAGIVGQLLRLAGEHDPPRPGVPAPHDWCSEEYLRMELERHSDDVELAPQELALSFASRDEALDRLFAALRPLAWAPDQAALRAAAAPLAGGDEGPVDLRATYVMAVARRRPS